MAVQLLSAGVIPVAGIHLADLGETPLFLLLRAYRYWDFPKGMVEPGEAPFAAARRELIEETGLAGAEFPFGEVYVETDPYGRNKVARYYIGRVKHVPITLPVSEELGRPEHHEARWVAFEEGCGLLNDRVEAVLRWAVAAIRCAR